jgi:uncharacterized membrane protein HdeD (DUF308 family)
MHIAGLLGGIIAVIFGIIVFIFPKILNYLVGAFLLIAGGIAIWQALV